MDNFIVQISGKSYCTNFRINFHGTFYCTNSSLNMSILRLILWSKTEEDHKIKHKIFMRWFMFWKVGRGAIVGPTSSSPSPPQVDPTTPKTLNPKP